MLSRRMLRGEYTDGGMNAPPRSVLIVDDDRDIRDVLTEVLADEGFLVKSATNGQEATEWLHKNAGTTRVILLDLMMPVMDGSTFLRLRESDPVLSLIPVVVMTAHGNARLASRTDVGAWISKPIDLDRLISAIHSFG
jgi:CheY-like chemotaxis protein